jgi:hypothetical protein
MSKVIIIGELDTDTMKVKCVGEQMRELFEEVGFSVYNFDRWDERLAPVDWDTAKLGMPNTYHMIAQIDFKKEL